MGYGDEGYDDWCAELAAEELAAELAERLAAAERRQKQEEKVARREVRRRTREVPPTDPRVAAALVVLDARQEVATWMPRANDMLPEHPKGKRDGAGRWYPSEMEKQPCCGPIRSPSAAWPRSLWTHCCSAVHVAALCNVSVSELRKALAGRKSAAEKKNEVAAGVLADRDFWQELGVE